MLPRRISRPDDHPAFTDSERHLILAAETLRAGEPRKKGKDDDKTEERLSVFWRVFGGTILSISALIVITAYQSLANGLHDVRNDIGRLRENGAEYIKKDEFNSRSTQMWNRLTELQSLSAAVTVLNSKQAAAEQQLATAERERKDMQAVLAQATVLKERLTGLEELRKLSEQDHKELLSLGSSMTALKDRDAALHKKIVDAETERREIGRELQSLRERLAKLEGRDESKAKP